MSSVLLSMGERNPFERAIDSAAARKYHLNKDYEASLFKTKKYSIQEEKLMDHHDHVALLRKGIAESGGVWADLGAGDGAFTLALAELIGDTGTIYAVDRDQGALRRLARAMQDRFPNVKLHTVVGNFEQSLSLPNLDGIVMANSLHFVRNKSGVLARIRTYLKPVGRLLVVEYNTDQGNMWVPYPFSYSAWERMAEASGFAHTERVATRPSRFLREIYSAASW